MANISTVVWVGIGLVLLIAEMLSLTFVLLFFGVSTIVVALAKLLGLQNLPIELAIFALGGLGGLWLFRAKLVTAIQAKKGMQIDQEAVICDLSDVNLGVCLFRKRDGTSLYATKDLALAKLKFENYQVTESLYVVGMEQNLHFKQVFETLKRMGFSQAGQSRHLAYDLVCQKDGKKMSSRAGTAASLEFVQNEVAKQVQEEFKKRGVDSDPQTARKIALAALKYAMLSQDLNKKVLYDLDLWLQFEGDTGPYLLYTYARMKSILRKLGNVQFEPVYELTQESEREFLHSLWNYKEVFEQAVRQKQVNLLANVAFEMCKAFNRFYLLCPVTTAQDEIK